MADKQSAISAVNSFLSTVGRDIKSTCSGILNLSLSLSRIDHAILSIDMQAEELDIDGIGRAIKAMHRSLQKSNDSAGLYADVSHSLKPTSAIQNLSKDYRFALFMQEISLSFAVSGNTDVLLSLSQIIICLSEAVTPAIRLTGTVALGGFAQGLASFVSTFDNSHLTKKKTNLINSIFADLAETLTLTRSRDADQIIRFAAYAHGICNLPVSRVSGLCDPYHAIRRVSIKSITLDDKVKQHVFDMCWDDDTACRVAAVALLTEAPEGYLNDSEFQDLANLIWDDADVADEALKFIDRHIFSEPGIFNISNNAVALLMLAEFLLQYSDECEDRLVGKLVSAILRIPDHSFILDFDLFVHLILNCDDIAPTPSQRPLRPEEKRGLLLLLCGVARVSENSRPAIAHAIARHGDDLLRQFLAEPRERALLIEIFSSCPGAGITVLSRILETTESVVEAEVAACALACDMNILSRVAERIVSAAKCNASPASLLRLAAVSKFIEISKADFLFIASLLEIVDAAVTCEIALPALRVCVFTAVRLRIAADAETAENLNLLISDCLHLCGKIAVDDKFPDCMQLNACIFSLYLVCLNSCAATPVVLEPATIASLASFIDRKLQCTSSVPHVELLLESLTDWDHVTSAAYRLDLTNSDSATEAAITIAALRLSPLSLMLRSEVGKCLIRNIPGTHFVSSAARETVRAWFRRMHTPEEWRVLWDVLFSVISDSWLSRGFAAAKILSAALASIAAANREGWLQCAIAFLEGQKKDDFLGLLKPWIARTCSSERKELCRFAAPHFSGRPLQSFLSSCRVVISTV